MGVFVPALAISGVLTLSFFIYQIIYRLYFHPLAKFPGPVLNKLSPVPAIVSLLRGRIPLDNKVLHDKYGSVVRVSPTELSYNSAQAWEDIYGHRQGMINMHKDPIHVGSVDPIPGVTTLTMADDANHARQRRALAYSFSQKALLEQEDIVRGYVGTFVQKLGLKADNGEQFNLVDWLNFTTFDIIGDLAFGEPFGCLKDEVFHDWVALIFDTIKIGAIEQATRRFAEAGSPFQNWLVNLIPKAVRARRRSHLTKSRDKVMRRLGKQTEHRDFIWYILQQREKRHSDLKDDEIVVNGALFIVAGSETTANLLSGLIARLLRNPDKYALLVKELRSTIRNQSDLTSENIMKLPYFEACLEEGLRIHPPVPAGLLRSVPKGGAIIDGQFVAEKTSVAVNSWAASHNPANFRNPDSFIPERWLDPAYDSDIKKGMQPFSLGPRGCIGKHLSYMEMRLILGELLWNFDLESTDGAWRWDPSGEMKYMKAFNTWQKPNLDVKLTRVVRSKV
ncbi:cytochrome P450 monooxygenase [Tothia fuscella]|uniref:Cytochrome P450 monooxygenase n=1 Tax=Tothia fuscella TaxID=1048955 RepID=A0A9P4NSJ1_9PEZI|nr:cytochrome P450 monooxygenase [Tothia fuscella]